MLLRLYTFYTESPLPKKPTDPEARLNGSATHHQNGRAIPDASDRQIRDAEEFELEGLMSEDEDMEDDVGKGKHQGGR